ncbi:hypothetical protein MMC17_007062 [Xylographa soralifera]|nr:hypothetical protein [Xylographa soralifera]
MEDVDLEEQPLASIKPDMDSLIQMLQSLSLAVERANSLKVLSIQQRVVDMVLLPLQSEILNWRKSMSEKLEELRLARLKWRANEARQFDYWGEIEDEKNDLEKRKREAEASQQQAKVALDVWVAQQMEQERELKAQSKHLVEREERAKEKERRLEGKQEELSRWEEQLRVREGGANAAEAARLRSLDTMIGKMERLSHWTTPRTLGSNRESLAETLVDAAEVDSTVRGTKATHGKRMSAMAISPKASTPKRARMREGLEYERSTVLEPSIPDNTQELASIDTVLKPMHPNPTDDVFGEPALHTTHDTSVSPSANAELQPLEAEDTHEPVEPMGDNVDHDDAENELDTEEVEPVILSDDLEIVFSQLVLPAQLSAIDKHALRIRMRDTAATNDTRKQPAYVFDSLARDASDNIPGHSCWTTKLQKGSKRMEGNTPCTLCCRRKEECVYASHVTGIVTDKGIWNGSRFAPNPMNLPKVKEVNEKRWILFLCRPLVRDQLKNVTGSLIVAYSGLNKLSLSKLIQVQDGVFLDGNSKLQVLELSSSTNVGGVFQIAENPQLQGISLPSLTTLEALDFTGNLSTIKTSSSLAIASYLNVQSTNAALNCTPLIGITSDYSQFYCNNTVFNPQPETPINSSIINPIALASGSNISTVSGSNTAFSSPPSPSSPSSTTILPSSSSGGLPKYTKIGLGIGLGVGIPLVVICVPAFFCFIRRKRTRRREQPSTFIDDMQGPTTELSDTGQQSQLDAYPIAREIGTGRHDAQLEARELPRELSSGIYKELPELPSQQWSSEFGGRVRYD